MVIDRIGGFKIILLFAVINSSFFLSIGSGGAIRAIIIIMLLISAVLLMVFSIKRDHEIFNINIYFKSIITLLFFWTLWIVLRGYSTNSKDVISMLGHYLMGWAWITPLAMGYGFSVFNWVVLFDFIGKLLLVGVVLTFLTVPILGGELSFGIVEWVQFFPVILLTYIYQKPFYKKVLILAVITFVILSVLNTQRISLVFLIMSLFFVTIEFYRYSEADRVKKIVVTVLISFMMIGTSLTVSDAINKVKNDKEATTDTRTFLFVELFQDLSEYDAWVGRGALGTYFSPYFALTASLGLGGDSSNRIVNEVGYLQMILKGGYILVILYLLILIPAAYLGIFHSRNVIARMSGYIIVIYLVIWTISYYPVYSAEYIFLWMAVGTAISPKARAITDIELRKKQEKWVSENE